MYDIKSSDQTPVSHNQCSQLCAQIATKSVQIPCTIVQGILPKMTRREFSIFIIFSDTYTCFYVA